LLSVEFECGTTACLQLSFKIPEELPTLGGIKGNSMSKDELNKLRKAVEDALKRLDVD